VHGDVIGAHISQGALVEFIIFGVSVGLIMGTGLYLLVIRPIALERAQAKKDASGPNTDEQS